jgi:hypothetical protein
MYKKMKRAKLYMLLFFVFMFTTISAQIPNSGFENWSGSDPVGWDNVNSVVLIPTYYTCTKGIPGNPGASFLKLTTKSIPIVGLVQGIALSGILDKTTFSPKSGFPFNLRPKALTGNWQYKAFGNDQGFIAIAFTKWNTTTQNRDTISTTYYLLQDSVMSWENFSIPITFSNSTNPDTCLIVLSSSSLTTPAANSYLYIDNLDFSFHTTISENIDIESNINIYPNPVTDQLRIEFQGKDNPSSFSYKIYNSLGQMVQSSGTFQHKNIKTSGLSKGCYQLLIEIKDKTYTHKFIRQ